MKYLYIILLLTISAKAFCNGNDTLRLSLKDVVEMAKGNSIAAKQAATTKETKYWLWRTYKSITSPSCH